MARRAGLPWDVILSAELFRRYKPDPQTYLGAAELLGLAPAEVMLVAAHNDDLCAAADLGLATAFVPRPGNSAPATSRTCGPGPASTPAWPRTSSTWPASSAPDRRPAASADPAAPGPSPARQSTRDHDVGAI